MCSLWCAHCACSIHLVGDGKLVATRRSNPYLGSGIVAAAAASAQSTQVVTEMTAILAPGQSALQNQRSSQRYRDDDKEQGSADDEN